MFGKVKTLVADKGFGFILGDDNKEYFMHKTSIVDGTLWDGGLRGKRCSFDTANSDKGPRAANVCFE